MFISKCLITSSSSKRNELLVSLTVTSSLNFRHTITCGSGRFHISPTQTDKQNTKQLNMHKSVQTQAALSIYSYNDDECRFCCFLNYFLNEMIKIKVAYSYFIWNYMWIWIPTILHYFFKKGKLDLPLTH